MKIFKVKSGIIIHHENNHYLYTDMDWDSFINNDDLYQFCISLTEKLNVVATDPFQLENEILPPIGNQEIWASGVTYYNSKMGREEESRETGGDQFYSRVYTAPRPELFFKSTAARAVGHRGEIAIRKDSSWDVPEPELTLMVSSSGKIIGYTIGNDVSSRSIEGENPLYLPQAKTYDNSASIGPCIWISEEPIPDDTGIQVQIERKGETVFSDSIGINQMKRRPRELVDYLYESCSFPYGCLLMTGTGIVPGHDFTLHAGDVVHISIDHIGTLSNTVKKISYNKVK